MALDSEEWRMRGNEDFEKAKNSAYSKSDHFGRAMDCYTHAMDLAKTEEDYSSAAKNYATTCVQMMDFYEQARPWDRDSRIKHTSGALEYFSKAISRGSPCQSERWLTHITKVYETSQKAALRLVEDNPPVEKAHLLQTLVKEMYNDNNKRQWLLKAVQILYDEAVRIEDDMVASDLLTEAIKPLEKARSLGAIAVHWEDSIDQKRREVGARLELQKAEHILRDATQKRMPDADLLFWSIDSFINTIKLAEDSKQEVEAEAYSRLGHIYDSIFNNPERAKNYYRKCIYISDNVVPKTFMTKAWYVQCTEAIKKFQKKAVEDADDAEYTEKKKYLEELEDDLNKLKAKMKDGIPSFLAFVSSEYPPKGAKLQPLDKTVLRGLDTKELRREVLKLVTKYHPDKQTGQEKKWKILCEEITKHINNILGKLKERMD